MHWHISCIHENSQHYRHQTHIGRALMLLVGWWEKVGLLLPKSKVLEKLVKLQEWVSRVQHINRLFRRWVFPCNQLPWYWQTKKRKTENQVYYIECPCNGQMCNTQINEWPIRRWRHESEITHETCRMQSIQQELQVNYIIDLVSHTKRPRHVYKYCNNLQVP